MASCAETCAACGSVRATAAAAATSAGVVGMTGRVYDALAHDASSTDVSVAVFHCDKRSGAFDDDADSSAASGCSHCALGERGTLHDALGERGANPQGALGALGERGSRLADGIGDRPCVPGERAGAATRPGVLFERMCANGGVCPGSGERVPLAARGIGARAASVVGGGHAGGGVPGACAAGCAYSGLSTVHARCGGRATGGRSGVMVEALVCRIVCGA